MSSVWNNLTSQITTCILYTTWRYQKQKPSLFHSLVYAIYSACLSWNVPHRVRIDSETALVAGKRSWTTKRKRADRFVEFTGETYLSINIGLIQERRTIYPLRRCRWSPNRVCAATNARLQSLRTVRIFAKYLELPRTERRHYSLSVLRKSFEQSGFYVCIRKVPNWQFERTIIR